jgi:hypothetical protein
VMAALDAGTDAASPRRSAASEIVDVVVAV